MNTMGQTVRNVNVTLKVAKLRHFIKLMANVNADQDFKEEHVIHANLVTMDFLIVNHVAVLSLEVFIENVQQLVSAIAKVVFVEKNVIIAKIFTMVKVVSLAIVTNQALQAVTKLMERAIVKIFTKEQAAIT